MNKQHASFTLINKILAHLASGSKRVRELNFLLRADFSEMDVSIAIDAAVKIKAIKLVGLIQPRRPEQREYKAL